LLLVGLLLRLNLSMLLLDKLKFVVLLLAMLGLVLSLVRFLSLILLRGILLFVVAEKLEVAFSLLVVVVLPV